MKKIYIFIIKTFICIIIFLSLAIIAKKNSIYKEKINKALYKNQISFSTFKKIYTHYLGGIFPLEKNNNEKIESVFNEKLEYINISPYQEGASLEVQPNYLIPNQESGIVTYIGEKEKYNKVIIIEGQDKTNIWYGNICNTNLKLYDYVEKNSYIGEPCNNTLYIVYNKEDKFLDYKKYLS